MNKASTKAAILLRDVQGIDLRIFFEHQSDPHATAMAAFPARDRENFNAHWKKIIADPAVAIQSILSGKHVAGYVGSFIREEKREVCYWLGREFWSKGIASQALKSFLRQDKHRPLFARVLKENKASLRVLEKCGFSIESEETFKNKEGREEEEYLLILLT